VKFESGAGKRGFDWRRADDKVVHARRIELPERTSMFPSGDLQLRGKLVMPEASTQGAGPVPAVVIVHGSESYDHGIIKFVKQEDGERRYTGIEPDYYPSQIAWLREHNGS